MTTTYELQSVLFTRRMSFGCLQASVWCRCLIPVICMARLICDSRGPIYTWIISTTPSISIKTQHTSDMVFMVYFGEEKCNSRICNLKQSFYLLLRIPVHVSWQLIKAKISLIFDSVSSSEVRKMLFESQIRELHFYSPTPSEYLWVVLV